MLEMNDLRFYEDKVGEYLVEWAGSSVTGFPIRFSRICGPHPKRKGYHDCLDTWCSGLAFTITDDERVLVVPYERMHWFPEYDWYGCRFHNDKNELMERYESDTKTVRDIRWYENMRSLEVYPHEYTTRGYSYEEYLCHWDKTPIDLSTWIQVNDFDRRFCTKDPLMVARDHRRYYDSHYGPDARKHRMGADRHVRQP